jgi:Putative secretion activating protein
MADVNKLVPFILKWEGGFVNDPHDLGGATNKGITIGTYRTYCQKKGLPKPEIPELKKIPDKHWTDILKSMYWDRWKADRIKDQSVANILVDWVWASGSYGIKLPQKLLRVAVDGMVGPITLNAVNTYPDQRELFDNIRTERLAFIDRIVQSRPVNRKYERGWKNRINDLKYTL